MNHSGKIKKVSAIALVLSLGLALADKNAMSATAPIVSNMPAIVDGASTPVRILTNPSGGYFVSDPRGGGVIKYDRNGTLISVFKAAHDAVGMALTQSGELLVTHDTSVVRLNPDTGAELGSFGSFKKAHAIAIDGAGSVYITDSAGDCVYKFTSAYLPDPTLPKFGTTGIGNSQFRRPAGIAYEKVSGLLAVTDSLNGRIQFYNTSGVWQKTLGSFGSGPLKFTMPKSVAFEYSGSTLSRYYVVDSFQSNVQVIDATTNTFLGEFGGYGYDAGNLVSPSDVQIDQSSPLSPVLLVANEIGLVTRYGIDNLTPTNVQVSSATLGQLTLTWTNPTIPSFSAVHIYQSTAAGILGTRIGGEITAETFTSTGLVPDATYYYTIRGVNNTAAETTNTDQYSGKTIVSSLLSVAQSGTGVGSITSSLQSPGLVYNNGVYTANVNSGTPVTLMATNGVNSSFTGWSGSVCNNQSSGDCVFTMGTTPVSVVANFDLLHIFKIAGSTIVADTLQEIYSQAQTGDTIMARSGIAPAYILGQAISMFANNSTTVKISGGYDPEFKAASGYTLIQGKVTLQNGKVIFNNIKIVP
jgi:hypothetical protein